MKLTAIETNFAQALRQKLLMYEVDFRTADPWLTVYYRENLGYLPNEDGSKWSLLCAQKVADYQNLDGSIQDVALVNRITLMLAEQLRSARQDVNGLLKENK